jgi:uncharacterized protein YbaP (TraB family)
MKLILLGFFSFCFTAGLWSQSQNSLLWKIESPQGSTSYLFGTYHLLGSTYLENNPKLDSLWKQCRTTVVETEIDSSQLLQIALMSMMPNTTLKELVDSTAYADIKLLLKELNIPLQAANRMKPIALSAAYSVQIAQENTPTNRAFGGTPIDVFLASEAKKQAQEVITLETMQEQLNMLYNAQSLEDQAENLVLLYRQKEEAAAGIQEILEAYFTQDLEAMYNISQEQEELAGDMALLLDERNQRWVISLKPILTKGDAFIAVGALHLAGEYGLINLLRREGYVLEPVNYRQQD